MSSPSPTRKLEKQHAFTVALTVYSSLKKNTKGKAPAPKEVKSVKTKELFFPLRDDNYLTFLQSILEKHGQDQYKVSARKRYSFKFVLPKAKGQCTISDAMDVDNEIDYKEMVEKLRRNASSTTKVLVDMKQVEKLPSSESGDETSDASDGDDDPKSSSQGAGDLDTHLARWRIKLQRLHKNEHDEGFTYVGPMGPLPLTPAMILDWCRALEDGEATLRTPPSIESFNMANRATHLHPIRKVQALSQPPPPITPSVDVNALTSVLLLQTLTKSGLIPSSTPATPTPTSRPVLPPVTPTRGDTEKISSSPLLPSPTQLSRFLRFAEANLGVSNASRYEVKLELQGIGPDILAEVDDKVLSDAGISIGNIIRLKRGCMVWRNSLGAKRKRSSTEASTTSAELPHPTYKKVAYEKRYFAGGGCRFSGPPMTLDTNPDNPFSVAPDYDLFYKCDIQSQWLPVPKGYVVDENAEAPAKDLDAFHTT